MFPLADPKGHVLGFGARALSPEDNPKYLNTSESDLFHKGTIVYGSDLARAAAARAGRVVLVEGYTDVIALRQAGVPEVVCSMGTALTDPQANALRRLAPTVLFCQDPDAAGQEAVGKALALDEMNKRGTTGGLTFRVVRLPPGLDPADVVQQQGAEAMRALLERAVPITRFEVERTLNRERLDTPEGREAALRTVAPLITRMEPGPVQLDLIQLVASRLQMSESMTQEALRSTPRTNGNAPAGAPRRVATSVDKREETERLFLARCLVIKEAGGRVLGELDLDATFSADLTRRAAHYLAEHLEHPGQALPAGADDLAKLVAQLVILAGDLDADQAALHIERLQLEKNRLDRAIAAAQREGEPVTALAGERQRVQDEIRHRLI